MTHSKSEKSLQQAPFVPGQLLVKFDPGVSTERATELLARHRAIILRDYSQNHLYLIALSDDMDVQRGSKIFNELVEVEFAEPNHIYKSED